MALTIEHWPKGRLGTDDLIFVKRLAISKSANLKKLTKGGKLY
jgi:hypothetical protein